jgi:hypothetical protein
MNSIQDLLNPELLNILYIILAVGIGWIVLRLLLKLASKVFQIGCLAIVVIGGILILTRIF